MNPIIYPVMFNAADADMAHDEWGANCGPGAVAAVLGMTLGDLRPYMGDFEQKGYTNPTLMWRVLDGLGVGYQVTKKPNQWPIYGLARIQWTGPWTKPGVPARAAYRHTHWVGVNSIFSGNVGVGVGIFDINAITNGSGWVAARDWESILVPWLLANSEPKADGGWFITHAVQINKPPTVKFLKKGATR